MQAARGGKRNMEDWEAAIIKAMLADPDFTRDQIVSYFTRPDRTVNPFRISEIAGGKSFGAVVAADPAQVQGYLQTFRHVDRARQSFFEGNPLHPVSLHLLLTLKEGTDQLLIEESDRFECKESLNFAHKAHYARLIGALANARGGVILFGVRDADKKVTGIKEGRLSGYDPAKLNQYLSSVFAPVPLWRKGEVEVADKTIGVIYVPQAEERPLICLKDDGDDLREGDIYYRYPGENRRIRPAELTAILAARTKKAERDWGTLLRSVERAGVENVAILNTLSGEVAGRSGRFLIDEALIPQLKFITEGNFSETDGSPTLKLLGDLQPLNALDVAAEVVDHVHLSDDSMIDAFVSQAMVANPRLFICHAVYSAKIWLPLFYFVRQAGMSDEEAAELLREQRGAKQRMIDTQSARLLNHSTPAGAAKPNKAEPTRSAILGRTARAPETADECRAFVKAVRTLGVGEIDAEFLLPILKSTWENCKGDNLPTLIQYAVAHVDVVWHVQERGLPEPLRAGYVAAQPVAEEALAKGAA